MRYRVLLVLLGLVIAIAGTWFAASLDNPFLFTLTYVVMLLTSCPCVAFGLQGW